MGLTYENPEDPIYKVYGDRDENSVSGVAEIMNQLDVIVAETGAAVVFAAVVFGVAPEAEGRDSVAAGAEGRDSAVSAAVINTGGSSSTVYSRNR